MGMYRFGKMKANNSKIVTSMLGDPNRQKQNFPHYFWGFESCREPCCLPTSYLWLSQVVLQRKDMIFERTRMPLGTLDGIDLLMQGLCDLVHVCYSIFLNFMYISPQRHMYT